MKLRFAFLGLLSLIAVSCSYEESFVPEDNNDNSVVDFYATIDEQPDADTKVYADDQLRVLWNADDRVTIFNKNTYNQQYRFTGQEGANAGGFRKVQSDDEFITSEPLDLIYSVYPYQETTYINYDETISFVLPAEQTYKDSSFGIGANTMVSKTADNQLRFKNVGGYLSLKFYGEGVSISSITLKGKNGELLAGKCTIDMTSSLPVLTMDEERASNTVTLICNPAVQLGASSSDAVVCWFVLPPVTFTEGITVTVTTSDGGVFEKSTSNKLEISRSSITKMGALEVVPIYIGNIDFADEDFKAYCVENFDQDSDGEISYEEALDVEAINVYTDEIESIEEIRYFKNLTQLCVRGSAAAYKFKGGEASGYYSDISDLPGYTEIEEGTSIATGSLTSIDLRGLNRLQELDVTGNNMITIHNIGDCVRLTSLGCAFCNLSSLELTNNTALESLLCFANQLTSLDVSKNTALKELSCGANPLTSLDLSNNTFLLNLYCGESMLTSLNVNNNAALIYLDCANNQLSSLDVSNCTSLQNLHCSNNQLSSLDVSKNLDLQTLWCFSNQLSSLDVSNNTVLQSFYCNSNPGLTEIWLKMGQTIENMQYDADIATIKYKGIENVVPFEDEFFKAYMVENFDTDSDGEISFDEALLIEEMSFYTNYISSIKGIEYCKHLKNLYCVGPGQFDYIYGGDGRLTSIDLSQNSELTRLNCSGNQLESLDISNNSQLNWLECYGNKLTDLDVSCNTLLEYLDCSPMNDNSGNNLLASLYIASGQSIPNITVDRDYDHIAYNTHIVVMPEAVDLGLSVKWASFNIGATKPEEFGDYYAWGELEPRETFSYDYKWYKSGSWGSTDIQFSKYNTSSATLEKEDDIANFKWGDPWRMPTYNEQTELRTQCDWVYAEINGVTGWKVQSRTNGNSIFLPDAGNNNSSLTGSWRAQYWSSTLYPYSYFTSAYCLEGIPPSEGDGDRPVYYSSPMRCSGLTVRAVQD